MCRLLEFSCEGKFVLEKSVRNDSAEAHYAPFKAAGKPRPLCVCVCACVCKYSDTFMFHAFCVTLFLSSFCESLVLSLLHHPSISSHGPAPRFSLIKAFPANVALFEAGVRLWETGRDSPLYQTLWKSSFIQLTNSNLLRL